MAGPPIQILIEMVQSLGWAVPIMLIIAGLQVWILTRCLFTGVDAVRMVLYFGGTLAHLTTALLAAVAADIRVFQVLGLAGMTDPALLASRRSGFYLGLYGGLFIAFVSALVGVLFFALLEMRRTLPASRSIKQ